MKPADYLKAIRRRWGDVLLAVAVALGAGWLVSSVAPAGPVTPEFRASSIILSGNKTSSGVNLKTLAALLRVDGVGQRVAEDLDFTGNPSDLALDTIATVDDEAGILQISATAASPNRAMRIANSFGRELVGFFEDQQATNLIEEAQFTRSRIDGLQRDITALERKIAGATGARADILGAQRDADVAQLHLLYQTYQQLADSSIRGSGLQILPSTSAEPAGESGFQAPRSFVSRMILAGILGLVAGIVIVLVIERYDTRIRTRRDAEKGFGLPVLGEIPYVTRSRRRGLAAASDPRSRTADAFRLLGTVLAFRKRGDEQPAAGNGGGDGSLPARTILVTSPGPGDGKTTVVANLAAIFAEKGKEVIVLSCDFRRPRIHKLLGTPNTEGLTTAITSSERGEPTLAPCLPTSVKDVSLVPSGPPPERPGELLASKQMQVAIQKARRVADVVIMDTAPILTTSDAAHLIDQVDAVLVVARAGRTTVEVAERTTDLLRGLHAPIAGVALNAAAEIASPRRYYGYYDYQRGDGGSRGKSPNGDGRRGFPRLARLLRKG